MADLPGHSGAITDVCTMKSEVFDEIGTWGKCNIDTKFLKMVFGRNNYLLMKLECRILRETTVFNSLKDYGSCYQEL